MFDRDPANIPFRVQIKQGVLVQIPGLGNLSGPKLDVERVGVLEVADFQDLARRILNNCRMCGCRAGSSRRSSTEMEVSTKAGRKSPPQQMRSLSARRRRAALTSIEPMAGNR